jgi:hypothetical protein
MYLEKKAVRIITPHDTRTQDALGNKELWCAFAYREENGYVYLDHGDVYAIELTNDTHEKNDVTIEIDGKAVGTWRLNAKTTTTIERSADDRGLFTFYEIGSAEAIQTDLDSVPKEDLGLIKVTFIPEKSNHMGIPVVEFYSGSKGIGGMKGGDRGGSTENLSYQSKRYGSGQSADSSRGMTRGAGGTGLSGRSSQEFGRAQPMELDYDRTVIINLRLVAKPKNEPRPLRAVSRTISNEVPPPVN